MGMKLNESGLQRCMRLLNRAERFRVKLHDDGVNVPVVDCGVKVPGSVGAGIALAEASAAGLATVRLLGGDSSPESGPHISFRTDQPVAACMAAQYAGWKIDQSGYVAMGSGPMRAAAGSEAIFDSIGYRETTTDAIGVLESATLPSPAVCQRIAHDCEVDHRRLTLMVAPTTSIAGTIQIVARSVETALHKLHELKFDISTVISGWGVAPMPPVSPHDLVALGRTNDAVIYGSHVHLWVDTDDDLIADLIPSIPSCASETHGQPFAELFEACGRDFYKLDPMLFSPAWICMENVRSGRRFEAGVLAPDLLARSFAV